MQNRVARNSPGRPVQVHTHAGLAAPLQGCGPGLLRPDLDSGPLSVVTGSDFGHAGKVMDAKSPLSAAVLGLAAALGPVGLLGLDGWSHVWVFWWFDKNDTPRKRSILEVHPRGDRNNPRSGVFATRAPVRPNLIALSLCKIISVKENLVEIESIDAFDGTPVLDLKPYAPGADSASATTPDWARHNPPQPSPAAESSEETGSQR